MPNADLIIGKVTSAIPVADRSSRFFTQHRLSAARVSERTLVFPTSLLSKLDPPAKNKRGKGKKMCIEAKFNCERFVTKSLVNIERGANRSGGFCERTQRIDRSSLLARVITIKL